MSFCCLICCEQLNAQGSIATKCGHVFHRRCLRPWMNRNRTCPTCRARINRYKLTRIYLSSFDSSSSSSSSSSDGAAAATRAAELEAEVEYLQSRLDRARSTMEEVRAVLNSAMGGGYRTGQPPQPHETAELPGVSELNPVVLTNPPPPGVSNLNFEFLVDTEEDSEDLDM